MTYRLLLLRLFLIGIMLMGKLACAAQIAVVLSDPSPPYQEFLEGLRQELRKEANEPELLVLDRDQASTRSLHDATLVIAVGAQAAQLMVGRDLRAPLLAAMLPRSSYERMVAGRRDDRRVSAIFIDQPPNRYIDLVRIVLPDVDRIGMLIGRDGRDTVNRLAQTARERKLRVHTETINGEGEIYPALQRMFADGGVLVATPDATVFNAQTVQNILLSAYRMQVPVIGFSSSFVNKAGALVALYSTPAQIGRQCAETARSVIAGGSLPAAQYPRLFSVGVNNYVARAMNIEVDGETAIRERLERLERLERGL